MINSLKCKLKYTKVMKYEVTIRWYEVAVTRYIVAIRRNCNYDTRSCDLNKCCYEIWSNLEE